MNTNIRYFKTLLWRFFSTGLFLVEGNRADWKQCKATATLGRDSGTIDLLDNPTMVPQTEDGRKVSLTTSCAHWPVVCTWYSTTGVSFLWVNCAPKNQYIKLSLSVFSILRCPGFLNPILTLQPEERVELEGSKKNNQEGLGKNLILQNGTLRLKGMKIIAQYHTANQWQNYSNLWPSRCLLSCMYSVLSISLYHNGIENILGYQTPSWTNGLLAKFWAHNWYSINAFWLIINKTLL